MAISIVMMFIGAFVWLVLQSREERRANPIFWWIGILLFFADEVVFCVPMLYMGITFLTL